MKHFCILQHGVYHLIANRSQLGFAFEMACLIFNHARAAVIVYNYQIVIDR